MADKEPSRMRKLGEQFRAEGIAFAIPMVLVGFPITGALLGRYLGQRFGWSWSLYIGLVLGFFLGVKECIRLVKLLSAGNKKG